MNMRTDYESFYLTWWVKPLLYGIAWLGSRGVLSEARTDDWLAKVTARGMKLPVMGGCSTR
jgi:hypothetical protein